MLPRAVAEYSRVLGWRLPARAEERSHGKKMSLSVCVCVFALCIMLLLGNMHSGMPEMEMELAPVVEVAVVFLVEQQK